MDRLSCNFSEYTNLLDQPLIVRLYFCDKVLKIAYPILLKLLAWIFWNLSVELCHNWMEKEWKIGEEKGKTLNYFLLSKCKGGEKDETHLAIKISMFTRGRKWNGNDGL